MRLCAEPLACRQTICSIVVVFSILPLGCGGGGPSSAPPPTPNPVLSISSLSPMAATAGGAAFTLTVNGTGFVGASMVQWNGTSRTTTFVSSTQLTAAIPASDIAAAGSAQVTVFNPAPGGGTSNAQTFTISGSTTKSAIHFSGYGINDIDRIKIRIDDPSNPAFITPPVNVGATDFTIEFWVNGATASNTGSVSCGPVYGWITGNIVYDRDRFNQGRAFGISFSSGAVAFGVQNDAGASFTLCGRINVLDGRWHHVAVERRFSDGQLWIFVDGVQDSTGAGPTGDISYPKGATPGSFCGPNRNQPCTNSDPFIVLGAEKHDAGSSYPSFNGFFDELRISNVVRYVRVFTPPSIPFVTDGSTMGLYHFDEGSGTIAHDSSTQTITNEDGVLNIGGTPPSPQWTTTTPF